MTAHNEQDWDPHAAEVLADPITAYDHMRGRCPVAYSDYLQHSVFRHADVMDILLDQDTFSNTASSHVSVPNSMDPPEHTAYRQVIEPYFGHEQMTEFEPLCRRICADLIADLPRDTPIELMSALAHPFALQIQCAFLGWSEDRHEPLQQWIHKKNTATLSGDKHTIAAVAHEFDETIRAILKLRRDAGDQAPDDVTTRLMHETVNGKRLTEEEIVSILRNWTVGELGTIAASVGIIGHYLAQHPEVQEQLRQQPDLVRSATDEILRIHAPLVANRRVPTCPVRLGDRQIPAGERLTLFWASANRDETVFGDPDTFRLDRDPNLNLLYGTSIHVCPGAPLARLELEAITQELLAGTQWLQADDTQAPVPAVYPASGHQQVMLTLQTRHVPQLQTING